MKSNNKKKKHKKESNKMKDKKKTRNGHATDHPTHLCSSPIDIIHFLLLLLYLLLYLFDVSASALVFGPIDLRGRMRGGEK